MLMSTLPTCMLKQAAFCKFFPLLNGTSRPGVIESGGLARNGCLRPPRPPLRLIERTVLTLDGPYTAALPGTL